MKNIRLIILAFVMVLFTLACNTNQTRTDTPSTTGNEFAENAQYTCPMHPEVLSDEEGTCPKCGMKLEKVDKKATDTTNVQGTE